jgi:hypothetical protein
MICKGLDDMQGARLTVQISYVSRHGYRSALSCVTTQPEYEIWSVHKFCSGRYSSGGRL